ncbi:MAG: FAD-dependent oxidoreductase [Polyangiales bacterium]
MGELRIVVIGGVAAGTSAASQAKRRRPEARVTLVERGAHVSYGACGIPYNLEDPSRSMDDLVVVSAQTFRSERGIDVRLRTEAVAIDTDAKLVRLRDLATSEESELPYDKLVIATGAAPVKLPIPGMDLPGVHHLRELEDGCALKERLATGNVRRAAIIGAGYIGMEVAEAFRFRGLEVVVLEKTDQVVPGFEREIATRVAEEARANGVRLELGIDVHGLEKRGDTLVCRTDRGEIEADLVLVSVGVRPNVALAKAAGIQLGPTGAIAVDDRQRTSVPDVFAAGDCCEAFHRLTGMPAYVPLGTTANKQGKVAGANAVGGDVRFAGIVGTAGFKVFDLEVARTGLGAGEIARLGRRVSRSTSTQSSRGHAYPGGAPVTSVLFVDPETHTILGAQMVGHAAVAKRIDVFATAILAGLTVEEVEDLDLSYAPPFAPVYDPILIAANVATKAVSSTPPGSAPKARAAE